VNKYQYITQYIMEKQP